MTAAATCACGNALDPGATRCAACLALGRTAPMPASAPADRIAPGTVLAGAWRLVEVLGEGGMGCVYRAEDVKLNREVAVKVLSPGLARNPDFVRRFEHEARLLARLEHPGIVPIYAVGEDAGRNFFVMKLLRGESLRARMRASAGAADRGWVLQVMTGLGEALDHIHAQGLVHRDVKPTNVFLDEDGAVTLFDFGISRDLAADTVTTQGLGTPAYMSPEQLTGSTVGPSADRYALGVILFELLTGTLPFRAENDIGVGYQHVHAIPPDPRETAPHLGPAVAQLVSRALAKERAARFPSARALTRALEAAFESDAKGPRAPAPRPRWMGVMAAGVAVCGAVAAVTALARHSDEAQRTVPAVAAAAPMVPDDGGEQTRVVVADRSARAATSAELTPPGSARPERSKPAHRHLVVPAHLAELRVVTVFEGQPTWASLSIDGASAGGTPAVLKLPAGAHRLRVTRPGFKGVDRTVKLDAAHPLALQVELQP